MFRFTRYSTCYYTRDIEIPPLQSPLPPIIGSPHLSPTIYFVLGGPMTLDKTMSPLLVFVIIRNGGVFPKESNTTNEYPVYDHHLFVNDNAVSVMLLAGSHVFFTS